MIECLLYKSYSEALEVAGNILAGLIETGLIDLNKLSMPVNYSIPEGLLRALYGSGPLAHSC